MTYLRLSFAAAAMTILAGCAQPADPYAMVPAYAEVAREHKQSVVVTVSGGQATNPLWVSRVSSPDFQEALRTSLQKFKVFSQAVKSGGAEYRLDVTLLELKQPIAALDINVRSKALWKLTDLRTGKTVWQEEIAGPSTATIGDAITPSRRLELASEGAIRANIKAGVEKLGRLPF